MRHLLTIIYFSLAFSVFGQDFKEQFNQFRSQSEIDFRKEQLRNDSLFARTVLENWRQFHVQDPMVKDKVVKPQELPRADETLELKDIQHKPLETVPRLMRSFKPSNYEYEEEYLEEEREINIAFFGAKISQHFTNSFVELSSMPVFSASDLSTFWQKLSKSNYQKILAELLRTKTQLNLPDYGYYLLIEAFLEQLGIDQIHIPVYAWFLLAKSGYVARVGLLGDKPVLVMACRGKIYGLKYYSDQGVNFYLFAAGEGSYESFQSDDDLDGNMLDFTIASETRLPLRAEKKVVSYQKGGDNVSLEIFYNKNFSQLLDQFPQVEIAYYLNSGCSDLMDKSMEKSLGPQLSALSETQKAQYILAFTQKAFAYRSDARQFNREKVMYPEELFDHDYSDCDDRVVLMSYLIRKFTDIPIIALEFPQHVALALRLPAPTFGETISHKGYTFTFCDPTYFNAPMGAVIPTADRSKIRVIEF